MPAVGPVDDWAHPSTCQRTRSVSAAPVKPWAWCQAFMTLGVLGLHPHQAGRDHHAAECRRRVEVISQVLGREHHRSALEHRRFERLLDGQLGRWGAGTEDGRRAPPRPGGPAPGDPNRPSTSAAGKAANCPRVRSPKRWKSSASGRSTTSRSASTPTGNEARNAAAPPARTTWARPRGRPGWRPGVRRPLRRPVVPSREPIGEDRGHGLEHLSRQRLVPSVVAGRTPGGEGGRTWLGQLDHGVKRSTAPSTSSKARAASAGSAGTRSAGQQAWATRRRCPGSTPSSRAAREAATARLAAITAIGAPGGTPARPPAAATGQSGQWTTTSRGGCPSCSSAGRTSAERDDRWWFETDLPCFVRQPEPAGARAAGGSAARHLDGDAA